MTHLGIVELMGVCADLQHRNEQLFERIGGWVATTTDPAAQQLFAEACHRHAWHASLWAGRTPAIGRDPSPVAMGELADHETPGGRTAAYRDWLGGLAERHASLRERVDPSLDPATVRVLDLVDADLTALSRRLDASD